MTGEHLKQLTQWAKLRDHDVCENTLDLVAEVRRLKALVKDAEWAGEHSHGDGPVCPWCRSFERSGHFTECRAFAMAGVPR